MHLGCGAMSEALKGKCRMKATQIMQNVKAKKKATFSY